MVPKHDPIFASVIRDPRAESALPHLSDLCKKWRAEGEDQKTCHIIDAMIGGDVDQYLFVTAFFKKNDERSGGYSVIVYHLENLHAELGCEDFGDNAQASKDAISCMYDMVCDYERVDGEIDQDYMEDDSDFYTQESV